MKKRILVAEDDENVRRFVVRLLTMRDCEVTACADGKAAIAELESQGPAYDMVVSDYHMPHADGLDVMRAALKAGVKRLGFQSSGIGTNPHLMEQITLLAQELSAVHNGQSRFATLPKPYGLHEFDRFLDHLGLMT